MECETLHTRMDRLTRLWKPTLTNNKKEQPNNKPSKVVRHGDLDLAPPWSVTVLTSDNLAVSWGNRSIAQPFLMSVQNVCFPSICENQDGESNCHGVIELSISHNNSLKRHNESYTYALSCWRLLMITRFLLSNIGVLSHLMREWHSEASSSSGQSQPQGLFFKPEKCFEGDSIKVLLTNWRFQA